MTKGNCWGDIFKFIQLIENVNFGEAVKILAEKTGVRLPREMPKAHNKRLKGIEINQWTVKFYQEQLEENTKQKEYFSVDRALSKFVRFCLISYAHYKSTN